MKILRKKLFKTLPVWLLALLLVGSATAAFFWISNRISSWVTVSERAIELIGGFESPMYENETTQHWFYYSINNMSQSTGYIYLIFHTSSVVLDIDDITVSIDVDHGTPPPLTCSLVTGYPQIIANFQLVFLFEQQGGGAIDFSDSGAAFFGWLDVDITYNFVDDVFASIQVTSTLS